MEVMGIRDGTVGLMQRPVAYVPLDYQTFININKVGPGNSFIWYVIFIRILKNGPP